MNVLEQPRVQSNAVDSLFTFIVLSIPGGLFSPKSYVDVPAECRKSDFLYTNLWPNFPPISIPFLKEKHQIGCFLQ